MSIDGKNKKRDKKFRFSIDRGGTFTDVYAEVPGEPGFRVVKLLSEDPTNYEDAPREGIRRILAEYGMGVKDGLIDADCIQWIRMGTTVATNALLERKGARTALITTRGFGDILQIGSQERPHLFDLKISKPDLLYEKVIEVDERVRLLQKGEDPTKLTIVSGTTGENFVVCARPDIDRLRPRLQALLDQDITGLAVVFLHAYGYPEHEEIVGELAKELGFTQVSLSSKVMPTVKMVPRGDTTMVDGYLTPHIKEYLTSFRQGFVGNLTETNLLFMQSDGGLSPADGFTGSRAILSGPAGGVVGYGLTSYNRETGRPVIGFDMGGTSTDVSRYGGKLELTFETRTAGVRIQAPQLDIKTVAAGGGSRLFFENGMFRVGPESVGAHPGPICYRKGGHLSITDANLVLGRLQADYFPCIFGPAENQPLDVDAARRAMQEMSRQVNLYYKDSGHPPISVEETALGFLDVANEVMVRPIREVSVMRGFDIKEHVLATFGGAGSQHACAIAGLLGISTIFIHRFSGILSAYGIGLADTVVEKQEPAALVLGSGVMVEINQRLDLLQKKAEDELHDQGLSSGDIKSHRYLHLRYQGTDTGLMIEQSEDCSFTDAFNHTYRREFGFILKDRRIMVDDFRVRAVGQGSRLDRHPLAEATGPPEKERVVSCYFSIGRQDTDLYLMKKLAAGHRIVGPAIIIQESATIVIEPNCSALITTFGDVEITVGKSCRPQVDTTVDPVRLAVFSNLFMSIAEQMGRMLQKTAISTNIKERLDFSCALFDATGNLVANAPHVPVHLGAMSEAVRQQIRHCPDIEQGDVLLSNHPAAGGSHLPDMTVMTPVFRDRKIIFWVASRGHHADIGGISPGSMPPHSHRLVEEGAAIFSLKLVKKGIFQEKEIADLLLHPIGDGNLEIHGTRRLSDNLSDLKAQVAANQKGIDLILEMVDQYGLSVIKAYMGHVQVAAEMAVRERLKKLSIAGNLPGKGRFKAVDSLDDGSLISLAITINSNDGSAHFDFSGTGHEIWGNLNAPAAVTQSAILYCLRCLVEKDIPLNYGCLLPIRLTIPKGCLLDPSAQSAVVGGNVLTSQRVVDVILKAFRVAAASQGCMNNFTFGNKRFGYYETIGGGAGAGPDWHGQSGIHTHMTNTRITDPEILERRYPVLLRKFSLRKGSGGQGLFHGGDGLIREVEFLDTLRVAILSERRVFAPYGLAGGEPGKRGKNLFFTADGHIFNLGGKNEIVAHPGDRIRILTPGGGGYGAK